MKHFKRLFLSCVAFLLIFTMALFPGGSTRKEIRIFDTFENYTVDKPFKVYHSEEEYNKDTAIKDDPTYIKQFKTIDEVDPTKNGRQEIVPGFYLGRYYVFNDIDNPYKKRLKRLILLFDSVDALKKNVVVKMYKSDNCVSEMDHDIKTRFKGGKNFIKIIYRYDQQTGNIWCQLNLVPNCHLDQYLDFKLSQGYMTLSQALEIKKNSDDEKFLWYDYNRKYMSMPAAITKDRPGEKNAKNNSESSSRKRNTKRRSLFPNRPPPESAGVEAMNRYLIAQSYENSGIDLPPEYLLSPLDDPMLALANSLNSRRNNSFYPPGFKSPVSMPLPFPTRGTGLSMMPKSAPMGQDPSSISAVNPVISAGSWAAMSGPSSKEITTEVNELNQYTRFDNWGLEYDLNGNTTRKGTQKRRYDYRGNVVIYEDLTTHAEYKYDALNRRIEKIVNGKVTKYYHGGYQVIEERDEDDRVTKQYVYGDGIDEILQMKIYQGPYQGTYYYHTDANNSVTAVTDQEGNLIERVSYDIYGVPTFKEYITDPGNAVTRDYSIIGNEILWHSRRYDSESHTYYFRNRAYDPTMGRFLQTDPMGYRDSMNLYQGFNMNPLNFNDPWGMKIKFTGANIESDFGIFKSLFRNIGISNIDTLMGLDENGFVVLKKGMGSLITAPLTRRNRDKIDEEGFYGWLRYGTKNLKNYKQFHDLTLQGMFEYIINDPTTIEFQINPKKLSEYKFIKYGGGVFLDSSNENNFSLNRNHQIVMRGEGASLVRYLSLSVYDLIAHEFGHAYAFMEGFKQDEDDQENMFGELAVMMENLYRLRSSDANKVWLRPLHLYTYLNEPLYRFNNSLYAKKEYIDNKWFWYVYKSKGLDKKLRAK
ncbi:RHS repeat domain-containing protein [Acidobacteriota bacterium]